MRRKQFLWSMAVLMVLLWATAYGAYSGPKEFLFDLTLADALLVLFTAVLAYATFQLRKTVKRQDHHYTLTERAYVELSHRHPGISWTDGKPGFKIKLKNRGRTPCRLVDFKMGYAFWRKTSPFALPPVPVYDKAVEYVPPKGMLVPGGYIFVTGGIVKSDVDFQAAISADLTLLAYCYVEYRDIFGNLHHAGWGREYEPVNEGQENNLGYLSSEDYNYDRPAAQAGGQ